MIRRLQPNPSHLPSPSLDISSFFFLGDFWSSAFFPCFGEFRFNFLPAGDSATLSPRTLFPSSSVSLEDLRGDNSGESVLSSLEGTPFREASESEDNSTGEWVSGLSSPEGTPFSEASESEDNPTGEWVSGTWKQRKPCTQHPKQKKKCKTNQIPKLLSNFNQQHEPNVPIRAWKFQLSQKIGEILFKYLERAQPIRRLLPRRAHPGCSKVINFDSSPSSSILDLLAWNFSMRFIKLITTHGKRQCNIKLTYKMSWFSRNIAGRESVCICVKLKNQQQPRSQGVCGNAKTTNQRVTGIADLTTNCSNCKPNNTSICNWNGEGTTMRCRRRKSGSDGC